MQSVYNFILDQLESSIDRAAVNAFQSHFSYVILDWNIEVPFPQLLYRYRGMGKFVWKKIELTMKSDL